MKTAKKNIRTRFVALRGNEPMAFRGKAGYMMAKVGGVWYDSYTKGSKHRNGRDIMVEMVDLNKPLTPAQLKTATGHRDFYDRGQKLMAECVRRGR